MKRTIVFISLFLLVSVWQSCRVEHFLITDIRFHLAEVYQNKYKDKQQIVYNCTTTVQDKLVFVISYHTEFIAQNTLNISNSCYARTLGRVIDNPLLENTFSLKFNKPFDYNGKNIPELTDVFGVKDIREEIVIYENYMAFCNMGADRVIDFSQAFFKKATFQKTEHEVTFSCETSDGVRFIKRITINFE